MDLEVLRSDCLAKKGVSEEFPFGEDIFVYKVMGKIFALTGIDFKRISLKCDPEKGIELREKYDAIQPGYHLNKKHWITVAMDGSVPDKLVRSWVDDSYVLVVKSLNKSQKSTLGTL